MGKYPNSIDSKGRAIIPAKFRHGLGERCVLTRGADKCLHIFTPDALEKYMEEHIINRPEEDEQARMLKLSFFANVTECDIDKQGRIKIPAEFLEFAGIGKEMVNVGMKDYIQVWGKEALDEKMSAPGMDQGALMANMTKYVEKGGQIR